MQNLRHFDYLKSINADYIEELLGQYLNDPSGVDDSWRYLFDGLSLGASVQAESASTLSVQNLALELKAMKLITAYREEGHLEADVNPIYKKTPQKLSQRLGITAEELSQKASVIAQEGFGDITIAELETILQKTYCGTASIELGVIKNPEERDWIKKRFEPLRGNFSPTQADRMFLLKRLTESEGFEKFLHTRYVAQKRFSIEGGEALIPALDQAIETSTQLGAEEIVIGMAHRGRLNVMVNVFGKPHENVFTEFDDNYPAHTKHGEGDVKYHKGHSLDFSTRQGKKVHMSLGFNPSHLEFIGPVVIGMARAKQYLGGDLTGSRVFPILIHGDAAFAGQGVVYETLNASQVAGYKVGGTLHIVSNNQVGFTTDPKDARSTTYCTDLAKMLNVPIFHVNGDDPEAVWAVMKIATEYRYQFRKDVFIDLICYRKFGHNEGDEPGFTQPQLYKAISQHQTPRAVYAAKLVAEKLISDQEPDQMLQAALDPMQKALDLVRATKPEPKHSEYQGQNWSKFRAAEEAELLAPTDTSVSAEMLIQCANGMSQLPKGFALHPKLTRLFESRKQTVETGKQIDWGNAELLAYATLLLEGHTVRMTGQDVCRGTFTHRHAVIFDNETGEPFIPMNHIAPDRQQELRIFNSHLSETAALGIEFGFSITAPTALVLWEAQFGDFANGAQVIIDQFFATSESKWHRAGGLTLLLPHGYEGQGPEHSSARLERFLQLAGRMNIQVASVTTPAQLFHILRRQVKRPFRKPLVLMSPKSLLRHPKVISDRSDFTSGHFREILDDSRFTDSNDTQGVKKIIICSGKIYFELIDEVERRGAQDVAILRMEQFYPWPENLLGTTLERYKSAQKVVFVQEEPRNMGAWTYFCGMWTGALGSFGARFPKLSLTYVGREICASPAVGSKKLHDLEQKAILERAFQE
jgi:2-oxoglutarate dehydrogenase E1 component